MKKSWLLWTLILSSCAVFETKESVVKKEIKDVNYLSQRSEREPKKRMMVLPILDFDPARSEDLKEKIREGFIAELNRSGEVIAIDSAELKSNPSQFVKNNEYDFKSLSKPLTDLGITTALEAKVLDVRLKRKADQVGAVRNMNTVFEVITRVRIFNTRSAKEVFNTVKTVTHEQDDLRIAERVKDDKNFMNNPEITEILIKDALYDFAGSINENMSRVSWEGRIAAIQGEKIYLNVGRVSGLQIGDLLKVVDESGDIYDPEIGYHIGRVPGRAKGTLEVISYFGTDGAISVLHSGGGFKENDKVEVYQ